MRIEDEGLRVLVLRIVHRREVSRRLAWPGTGWNFQTPDDSIE